MPWTDHVGEVFYRRRDVMNAFGGNRIMGISHSRLEQTVIVVSDPNEQRYGYRDQFLPDGSYEYYGQRAQNGNPWENNNAYIRDHIITERSLLLFFKENGQYRMDGEWFYNNHQEIEVGPVGDRVGQVVFNIVRGAALGQDALEQRIDDNYEDDAADILERAIRAGNRIPAAGQAIVNVYARAAAVATHVLRRANGRCECCGINAPFETRRRRPYLECHHIDRRADNGPDDIYSVIALHPVCHRFIHHGFGGAEKTRS